MCKFIHLNCVIFLRSDWGKSRKIPGRIEDNTITIESYLTITRLRCPYTYASGSARVQMSQTRLTPRAGLGSPRPSVGFGSPPAPYWLVRVWVVLELYVHNHFVGEGIKHNLLFSTFVQFMPEKFFIPSVTV
jgi:hypothetical protein